MVTQTRQTWVNAQVQAEVLDLALNVGYHHNLVVDQVSLRKKDNHWQCTVLARGRGGRKVAYVTCGTYGDTLELAAHFAAKGLLSFGRPEWLKRQEKREKP